MTPDEAEAARLWQMVEAASEALKLTNEEREQHWTQSDRLRKPAVPRMLLKRAYALLSKEFNP